MVLDVECVLDCGMNGQEPLRRSGRFEPLHLALASTNRQVRILGPIVSPQALLMASRQSQFGLGCGIGTQFVGDERLGREALVLKQSAHKFRGRLCVAPPLSDST
jgi:hypothetical protein